MKKSDIAMIVLIAGISVLLAYFVASSLVAGLKTEPEKVKTAEAISSEVAEPNKAIFNENAINPTVRVDIGGSGR